MLICGSSGVANANYEELAIFNGALTQAQILAHYNASFAFEIPVTPEPSTILLTCGAVGALLRGGRRRHSGASMPAA